MARRFHEKILEFQIWRKTSFRKGTILRDWNRRHISKIGATIGCKKGINLKWTYLISITLLEKDRISYDAAGSDFKRQITCELLSGIYTLRKNTSFALLFILHVSCNGIKLNALRMHDTVQSHHRTFIRVLLLYNQSPVFLLAKVYNSHGENRSISKSIRYFRHLLPINE